MSMHEDGGPAFPGAWKATHDGYARSDPGMTLRDYFAAKAMQAIMLDKEFLLRFGSSDVATRAYDYADAMLEARK